MKAIFTVCLILAFACAQSTFVPEYQICQEGAGWSTKNISLDAAPVAGQNSTFTFCGQNRNFYVVVFQQVHATSGTVLDLTFNSFTGTREKFFLFKFFFAMKIEFLNKKIHRCP